MKVGIGEGVLTLSGLPVSALEGAIFWCHKGKVSGKAAPPGMDNPTQSGLPPAEGQVQPFTKLFPETFLQYSLLEAS